MAWSHRMPIPDTRYPIPDTRYPTSDIRYPIPDTRPPDTPISFNQTIMNTDLVLLCTAAFAAGFVDSIVGGGGLIQTPAALVLLPQYPVATVIGTLKIPAFTGTFFATLQYARQVKIHWKSFVWVALTAFLSAMTGSALLRTVKNDFMKPVILVVLIGVAIYTFTKKDFGKHSEKAHAPSKAMFYALLIGLILGFYDGFIGPGAGSFLILAFISLLGFNFLKASAHAKIINLATNMASAIYFGIHGLMIYKIALPMAICNGLGGLIGAKLALWKGNRFIRIFFLVIVVSMIIRFAYQLRYEV